jgi:hypothetical protein
MNNEEGITTHHSTPPSALEQSNNPSLLTDLIHLLQGVDTASEMAKLNESSMSDNNGGRIWF